MTQKIYVIVVRETQDVVLSVGAFPSFKSANEFFVSGCWTDDVYAVVPMLLRSK